MFSISCFVFFITGVRTGMLYPSRNRVYRFRPGWAKVFFQSLSIKEKRQEAQAGYFCRKKIGTTRPPVIFFLLENIRRKVRKGLLWVGVVVKARTFPTFTNTGFSRPIQDSVGKPALVIIYCYIRPFSASVTTPSLSCMKIVRICVSRESKTLR